MYLLLLPLGVMAVWGAVYWFEVQVFVKFKYKFFSKHSLYTFSGIVVLYWLGQYFYDDPKSDPLHISTWLCYAIALLIATYVIHRNFKNTNALFGLVGSAVQGAVLVPAVAFGLVIFFTLFALFAFSAFSNLVPTDKRTESEKQRDKDIEEAEFDAEWASKNNKAGPNYQK